MNASLKSIHFQDTNNKDCILIIPRIPLSTKPQTRKVCGFINNKMNEQNAASAENDNSKAHVKPSRWDRMTPEQKESRKAYLQKWQEANRKKAAAYTKKWREANKEKSLAGAARWRRENHVAFQKMKRAWEKANPDKVKEMEKRGRLKNAKTIQKRNLKYQRANRDKTREWNRKHYYKDVTKSREQWRITGQNRKHREKEGEGLSRGIVKTLMETQQHKCVYCPADLRETEYHLDHIKPLSKGGPHCDSNIQLLCASCNLSKFDRDHDEFLAWREANK